jgi:hypothetical protein
VTVPGIKFNNDPPYPTPWIPQKDDEATLVAWANEQYKKIKLARTNIERQWYLNLAFYYGRQNVSWIKAATATNPNSFRLDTPKAPPWRVRHVVNKIRPTIRTELAKLTAQKPRAFVIPASNDDSDIFAAQAGEQVYDSFFRRKDLKQELRDALFWTVICGDGYIKTWWDDEAVDVDSDQLGDVIIQAETPFHVLVPDFLEKNLENQPFLIHASAKSEEWVNANYGKLLKERKININTTSQPDILESSFLNLVQANRVQKNQVLCLEVWVKPGAHKLFPNGGMYTVLGDVVVQATNQWPYDHKEYPFAKFSHVPTGKFYSDSVVTDLVPLQREYNRTVSQIIESKNRMAKPQLIAPEGSVDPKKITTEPGQVILYVPGFNPPAPLPLQAVPSYVINELERIQRDMDDISGQHEVTKGRVPPGVTAATAISYLQEQDDSKLSHTVDSIESGVEKIGKHILTYVVQYWTTERIIKVVGNDGAFDAINLKASDLRGNTDIKIEAGSALPVSKAAKQAFIMDLMKFGWVPPDKGLEVLEIGGISKLYDELQTDQRQAQRENLRLQRVEQPQLDPMNPQQIDPQTNQPVPPPLQIPVNNWDNHAVHVQIHNKFRKSQAFEVQPDFVKQQFEQHVQIHEAMMMQQMMSQPQTEPGQEPGQEQTPIDPSQQGGQF